VASSYGGGGEARQAEASSSHNRPWNYQKTLPTASFSGARQLPAAARLPARKSPKHQAASPWPEQSASAPGRIFGRCSELSMKHTNKKQLLPGGLGHMAKGQRLFKFWVVGRRATRYLLLSPAHPLLVFVLGPVDTARGLICFAPFDSASPSSPLSTQNRNGC
jgi:hypothetical protein